MKMPKKEKVVVAQNGMPGMAMTVKHASTPPACIKMMKEMEKKKR